MSTSTAVGFNAVKESKKVVAACLRDIATLINERKTTPVTLENGGEVMAGLGMHYDAENLVKLAHDMEQGIFKLLVMGEFKNGKSTLLNAMLGENLLPSSAVPCTAIITMLVYGDAERVAIYEEGRSEPRYVSHEQFKQEFSLSEADIETLQKTGYLDRFQNVRYAVAECTHPFCANGIRLIDSPGLGEQISRTLVTTGYLDQAQAILYILNATQILSGAERELVDEVFGAGRLEHVFFVVNRIDIVEYGEGLNGVDQVKSWVRRVLTPHFLDAQGQLDEDFYRQRVFYTSAVKALRARTVSPADESALSASGVPALEAELESFLTSDEKMAATYRATSESLIPIVGNALRSIATSKMALDQPLAELEARRGEAERKLQDLENEKNRFENTMVRGGKVVAAKLAANFADYVLKMEKTWPEDAASMIDLDMGLKTMLSTTFSQAAKERLAKKMQEQINGYTQAKFKEWVASAPDVVDEDITRLDAELRGQLGEFDLRLKQIEEGFAGQTVELGTDERKGARIGQTVISLLLLDPSGATTSLIGDGNWGKFLLRALSDQVVWLALGFVLGPAGWLALVGYIIAEVVHIKVETSQRDKQLMAKIGQQVHGKLQAELPNMQAKMQANLVEQFRQDAAKLTQGLQAKIDEARRGQEAIIQEMQAQDFSADTEKARLDVIGEQLIRLLNVVNDLAHRASLTADDIVREATEKAEAMRTGAA